MSLVDQLPDAWKGVALGVVLSLLEEPTGVELLGVWPLLGVCACDEVGCVSVECASLLCLVGVGVWSCGVVVPVDALFSWGASSGMSSFHFVTNSLAF